jgi:hypothetical protein
VNEVEKENAEFTRGLMNEVQQKTAQLTDALDLLVQAYDDTIEARHLEWAYQVLTTTTINLALGNGGRFFFKGALCVSKIPRGESNNLNLRGTSRLALVIWWEGKLFLQISKQCFRLLAIGCHCCALCEEGRGHALLTTREVFLPGPISEASTQRVVFYF